MLDSKVRKVLVVNGPNLNLLGDREPEIYGTKTLNDINQAIEKKGKDLGIELEFYQSNHEGDIIDKINNTDSDGLIINPAAFTHTSVALADALGAFDGKVVEVHLSNIFSREEFRKVSLTAPKTKGVICGFGWKGYLLALRAIIE
ncbi:MAG: type II 3-dehydroquinate dehydratase [Elusimicrobiota bacterium]